MPATLSSDPLTILLRHDAWATRRLLNACRGMSRDKWRQEFDIGLKTLHETMTHIVSVMRRWTDRVGVRPVRPMLHAVAGAASAIGAEVKDRAPEELLALLDEAETDLQRVVAAALAAPNALAATLVLDFEGYDKVTRRYTFTKGAALAHLCTHNMHHRAQAHYMLRKLGVTAPDGHPLETGVTEWQADVEAPPQIIARA